MRKIIILSVIFIVANFELPIRAETVSVEFVYPEHQDYKQTLILSGTVYAEQDAALAPLEAGLVETI